MAVDVFIIPTGHEVPIITPTAEEVGVRENLFAPPAFVPRATVSTRDGLEAPGAVAIF